LESTWVRRCKAKGKFQLDVPGQSRRGVLAGWRGFARVGCCRWLRGVSLPNRTPRPWPAQTAGIAPGYLRVYNLPRVSNLDSHRR
jgi:hypothetical protein